jgi:hypothetical protein
MPPEERRGRTGTWPEGRSTETSRLWQAVETERERTEDRFDRLEGQVGAVQRDVTAIANAMERIQEAEAAKTKSAEKRDHRIWQVVSGVLIALTVAACITLFKVFMPIALTGADIKPPTVNQMIDQGRFKGTSEYPY